MCFEGCEKASFKSLVRYFIFTGKNDVLLIDVFEMLWNKWFGSTNETNIYGYVSRNWNEAIPYVM